MLVSKVTVADSGDITNLEPHGFIELSHMLGSDFVMRLHGHMSIGLGVSAGWAMMRMKTARR